MNYAIFRSEPIYTLNDLAQIGSHNKREKKAYQSKSANPCSCKQTSTTRRSVNPRFENRGFFYLFSM